MTESATRPEPRLSHGFPEKAGVTGGICVAKAPEFTRPTGILRPERWIAVRQRFFAALMAKYRTAGVPRPKDFFPRIDQIALYRLAIDRITGKQIVLPGIAGQWPALDRSKTPNVRPPD